MKNLYLDLLVDLFKYSFRESIVLSMKSDKKFATEEDSIFSNLTLLGFPLREMIVLIGLLILIESLWFT